MKVLYAFMLIFVTCCAMAQNRSLSPEDLRFKNYVVKEFNIQIPSIKRDIDTALLNKNIPFKEILIYPGIFKLRAYKFNFDFGYSPFAIKVMDSKDSILTFFSFTDEIYYMTNEVSGEYLFGKKITINKQDSRKPLFDRNLENNLNSLIEQLDYQGSKVKIENLLNVIFLDLLQMTQINDYEIRYLNSKLSRLKTKDPLIRQCIQEFSELEHLPESVLLCVNAKEGLFGYWIFSLDTESNKVKVRFVGDLIYFNLYL